MTVKRICNKLKAIKIFSKGVTDADTVPLNILSLDISLLGYMTGRYWNRIN